MNCEILLLTLLIEVICKNAWGSYTFESKNLNVADNITFGSCSIE